MRKNRTKDTKTGKIPDKAKKNTKHTVGQAIGKRNRASDKKVAVAAKSLIGRYRHAMAELAKR